MPHVGETVNVLALQTDGKIIVGGDFTFFDGQPRQYIVRLNAGGSVDPAFTTGTGFDGEVTALTVRSTGIIMASGWFGQYKSHSQIWCMPMKSSGGLVGLRNPFSVHELHSLNDFRQVSEAA